jgi:hypothetical protein
MIDAMRAALKELEDVLECINQDKIPFDGDDFHETLRNLRQAIAEAEKQAPSTSGVIFAVEQSIESGDCPMGIVLAYEDYEAKRKESTLQEISDIGREIGQEPAGVIKTIGGYPDQSEHTVEWNVPRKDLKDGQPVYTAPPKREWQGLTDNEIKKVFEADWNRPNCPEWVVEFSKKIEAKLKELNQ